MAQKRRVAGWMLLAGLAMVGRGAEQVDGVTVLLVVGAEGEAEYRTQFAAQVPLWEKVAAQAGAKKVVVGTNAAVDATTDLERLKQALAAEPKTGGELWVVLIGHGTYDGKDAKFNLRGPDLTATELATWLKPFNRPLAVINTASASAPFISKLGGANRVVITATRTGNEHNFARLGPYLAEAMGDPKSDLDQDGQTSLLEAFLSASARVKEFYKTEGRLATEHALIDDNGDGLGTPAEWFRGTRATKKAKDGAALDGTRARQFHLVRSEAEARLTTEQRARRDELERAVEALRESKAKLGEAEYYGKLEALMVELAQLYGTVGGAAGTK
ncbi:MAG: hypothetical protein H7343_04810 [Undibacterium sp.]|nr:hypothetical protein [Opitutaceae bacterium]